MKTAGKQNAVPQRKHRVKSCEHLRGSEMICARSELHWCLARVQCGEATHPNRSRPPTEKRTHQTMANHGKPWQTMANHGKPWQILIFLICGGWQAGDFSSFLSANRDPPWPHTMSLACVGLSGLQLQELLAH